MFPRRHRATMYGLACGVMNKCPTEERRQMYLDTSLSPDIDLAVARQHQHDLRQEVEHMRRVRAIRMQSPRRRTHFLQSFGAAVRGLWTDTRLSVSASRVLSSCKHPMIPMTTKR